MQIEIRDFGQLLCADGDHICQFESSCKSQRETPVGGSKECQADASVWILLMLDQVLEPSNDFTHSFSVPLTPVSLNYITGSHRACMWSSGIDASMRPSSSIARVASIGTTLCSSHVLIVREKLLILWPKKWRNLEHHRLTDSLATRWKKRSKEQDPIPLSQCPSPIQTPALSTLLWHSSTGSEPSKRSMSGLTTPSNGRLRLST